MLDLTDPTHIGLILVILSVVGLVGGINVRNGN